MSHVFISYRRDGGEAMAQLIHDRLVSKHVDVFYDIDDLNSSKPFDSMLFHKIDESNDVVLILPPQALDRCRYENDWVRQEIRHALLLNKNIIPIMMRGFEFPSNLPDDIKDVSRFNGVRIDSMEFLDAKIDKVISFMSPETRKAREALEAKERAKNEVKAPERSTGVSQNDKKSGIYGFANPGRISIVNVCTMGAVDRDEPWPKGMYSPNINLDECNVVRFHVNLLRKMDKNVRLDTGFHIYDAYGNLVAEHRSEIDFSPNDNRFSLGWIIRGLDGSYVKAGAYRAEIWLGDSEKYTVNFRVNSSVQSNIDSENNDTETILAQDIDILKKNIYKTEGKLNTYKVLISNILTEIMFFIFVASVNSNQTFSVLSFVVMAIVWIINVKNTRKYVNKSFILAILLTTVVSMYFGIYLLVVTISAHVNKDQLKNELIRLKSTEIKL